MSFEADVTTAAVLTLTAVNGLWSLGWLIWLLARCDEARSLLATLAQVATAAATMVLAWSALW